MYYNFPNKKFEESKKNEERTENQTRMRNCSHYVPSGLLQTNTGECQRDGCTSRHQARDRALFEHAGACP